MNENDINVLLDHFVGALDSSESSSVAHKINTLPLWSKTYKQINQVFGSLQTIKEEDSKKLAPEGLASKTFQKILEQKKSQQSSSEFIAQKAAPSEQTVHPTSRKRVSVKPSFLALSACAGFLFIVALAVSTSFFGNSNSSTISNPNQGFAKSDSSSNNPTNFAVTGSSQQPSSSFYFCSDPIDATSQNPFSNDVNNLAINSSEQLVDLTGSSVYSASEHRDNSVNMACPDGFVVLSPKSEGRPIIVVPPRHFPRELMNIQDVFDQPNANFVAPVNYQK